MPNLEALREEDKALTEMFSTDEAKGLSPEDEAAYRELIDGQREGYQATQIEVKGADADAQTVTVRGIGNRAFQYNGGMAVHSESWLTEKK